MDAGGEINQPFRSGGEIKIKRKIKSKKIGASAMTRLDYPSPNPYLSYRSNQSWIQSVEGILGDRLAFSVWAPTAPNLVSPGQRPGKHAILTQLAL